MKPIQIKRSVVVRANQSGERQKTIECLVTVCINLLSVNKLVRFLVSSSRFERYNILATSIGSEDKFLSMLTMFIEENRRRDEENKKLDDVLLQVLEKVSL